VAGRVGVEYLVPTGIRSPDRQTIACLNADHAIPAHVNGEDWVNTVLTKSLVKLIINIKHLLLLLTLFSSASELLRIVTDRESDGGHSGYSGAPRVLI
jgi:hypothetical protein